VKYVLGTLTNQQKLTLSRSPHGSATALFDDCTACAVDGLMTEAGGVAWDEKSFTRLHDHVRAGLFDAVADVVAQVERILTAWHEVTTSLPSTAAPLLSPAIADIEAHLSALVHPGFVAEAGTARLPDLLRYVRALARRLDKLPDDPHRDRARMDTVHALEQDYRDLLPKLPPSRSTDDDVTRIPWMLEELRVSFFAQTLGTPYPVSEKRIRKAMDAALG
jgi:ATP-dependent helicase HrpA